MAYPHAYEAMVRRAVRSLPGRDPLRKELRGLDDTTAQAGVLLRAGRLDLTDTDEADLRTEDLATLVTATLAILADAAFSARTVHYDAGLPTIAPDRLEVIADKFAQSVADLIRYRVQHDSTVQTVPVGLSQTVLRDVAAVPPEHGYNPAGSGFSEIGAAAVRERGGGIYYEWVHGFFGEPQNPDPEHLYLSGSIYANPAVLDGRYVGDHPGCTCFNLPKTALN